MHASQASVPTCIQIIDSTSGLVWRTGLRPHTSASSVLPSPLATRMSLRHLTLSSPTYRLSCVMYSASVVSSLKRQPWGIRQALCALFHIPLRMHISHPMLACRRRPLDTGKHRNAAASSVCRTRVHSARTPTTRPLPRPAAIASRHATSRAMQVTSALLLSQAATAALFTTQPMSVSISCQCKPTYKALHCQRPIGKEGGRQDRQHEARVDDASLRCHH
jgi:hypothetical protein